MAATSWPTEEPSVSGLTLTLNSTEPEYADKGNVDPGKRKPIYSLYCMFREKNRSPRRNPHQISEATNMCAVGNELSSVGYPEETEVADVFEKNG